MSGMNPKATGKRISGVMIFAGLWFLLALPGTARAYGEPGNKIPLWNWRLYNGGALPQTVFYHIQDDILQVTIEDGAPSVASNQMLIVLTSNVNRPKELSYWWYFGGKMSTVATKDSNRGPNAMLITAPNYYEVDYTLVLTKAKYFGLIGWMADMYHLDSRYFWRVLAGKRVTINWLADSENAPYQLGSCPIVSAAQAPFTVAPCIFGQPVPWNPPFFDTDARADLAVWRPWTGDWFVINSSTGGMQARRWGLAGDVPVPGDYEGDGMADIAIWRPGTGEWWIDDSFTQVGRVVQWGQAGDVPVPGDYDGNRTTDIAIWRPSTGDWWIINSSNGSVRRQQWGMAGDIPVPGDYDRDGKTDTAIWRPSTGDWWIINSSNGSVRRQQWGTYGDVPVAKDYDNDGKTDIAVWRPSTGIWWIINSSTGWATTRQWGQFGDVPVPHDYDGDGRADIAVWRPSDGVWWIINSSTWGTTRQWGTAGDVPLPVK